MSLIKGHELAFRFGCFEGSAGLWAGGKAYVVTKSSNQWGCCLISTILSDVDHMIYYTMRCRFTINVSVSEQKAEPGGVLACSPV